MTKKRDTRQTPEARSIKPNMNNLSESSDSENESTQQMYGKLQRNEREARKHLKITNISNNRELSISDIKANPEQEDTY